MYQERERKAKKKDLGSALDVGECRSDMSQDHMALMARHTQGLSQKSKENNPHS